MCASLILQQQQQQCWLIDDLKTSIVTIKTMWDHTVTTFCHTI